MTYLELYEDAMRKLHNSLITLGEFEMMIKPLNREVEAKPKTGEWVEKGRNEDGTHNIVCDKCGAGYKTRGHARSINTKRKYRFCPSCGADMRGEKE